MQHFMETAQKTSWIFLSLAISSKDSPSDFEGISDAADYINRLVPTESEIKNSLNWLVTKKLVAENLGKYSLTESGKKIYTETEAESKILLKMWKSIEEKFNK